MPSLTILPAIATPLLNVREIRRSDSKALAIYMTRTDYQWYLAVRYRDAQAVAMFVERAVARQEKAGRSAWHLVAETEKSHRIVGDGFILVGSDGAAEIGWGVDPELWGMGYATEISRALIAQAFERLSAKAVWCKVMVGNKPSVRVAEKAGLHEMPPASLSKAAAQNARSVRYFKLEVAEYFEAPY